MKKAIFLRTLHLAIGIAGVIFFASFDILRGHPLKFGLYQFAGITISAVIVLSGISDWLPWSQKNTLGALFLLYLGGLFFMGFFPHARFHHHAGQLLVWGRFSGSDAVINILGFVPFGFLAMILLTESGQTGRWQALGRVLVFSLFVSLTIEIVQYFLPGRTSSLIDVLTNVTGALCGAALSDLEHRTRPRAG